MSERNSTQENLPTKDPFVKKRKNHGSTNVSNEHESPSTSSIPRRRGPGRNLQMKDSPPSSYFVTSQDNTSTDMNVMNTNHSEYDTPSHGGRGGHNIRGGRGRRGGRGDHRNRGDTSCLVTKTDNADNMISQLIAGAKSSKTSDCDPKSNKTNKVNTKSNLTKKSISTDEETVDSVKSHNTSNVTENSEMSVNNEKSSNTGKTKTKSLKKTKFTSGSLNRSTKTNIASAGEYMMSYSLPERTRILIQALNESPNCGICVGDIEPKEQVWNCTRCHEMYHYQCVDDWAQSNFNSAVQNSSSNIHSRVDNVGNGRELLRSGEDQLSAVQSALTLFQSERSSAANTAKMLDARRGASNNMHAHLMDEVQEEVRTGSDGGSKKRTQQAIINHLIAAEEADTQQQEQDDAMIQLHHHNEGLEEMNLSYFDRPHILHKDRAFSCPSCNHFYSGLPVTPSCFCGKSVYPEYNPKFLPHSCEEPCGKSRGNNSGSLSQFGLGDGNDLVLPKALISVKEIASAVGNVTEGVDSVVVKGGVGVSGDKMVNILSEIISLTDQHYNSSSSPNRTERPSGYDHPLLSHLNYICPHLCQSPCHPGPCSSCVQHTPPIPCACGDSKVVLQCSNVSNTVMNLACDLLVPNKTKIYANNLSCSKVCGKKIQSSHNDTSIPLSTINSGDNGISVVPVCIHSCHFKCHAGPCPPCVKQQVAVCSSGHHVSTKTCGNYGIIPKEEYLSSSSFTNFSKLETSNLSDLIVNLDGDEYIAVYECTVVCDNVLDCQIHSCTRSCHPEICHKCTFTPSNTDICACGKTTLHYHSNSLLNDGVDGNVMKGVQHLEGNNPRLKCTDTRVCCSLPCTNERNSGYGHTDTLTPISLPVAQSNSSSDINVDTPPSTILSSASLSHIQPGLVVQPCTHYCGDNCHNGDCKACTHSVDLSCRCGRTDVGVGCNISQLARSILFSNSYIDHSPDVDSETTRVVLSINKNGDKTAVGNTKSSLYPHITSVKSYLSPSHVSPLYIRQRRTKTDSIPQDSDFNDLPLINCYANGSAVDDTTVLYILPSALDGTYSPQVDSEEKPPVDVSQDTSLEDGPPSQPVSLFPPRFGQGWFILGPDGSFIHGDIALAMAVNLVNHKGETKRHDPSPLKQVSPHSLGSRNNTIEDKNDSVLINFVKYQNPYHNIRISELIPFSSLLGNLYTFCKKKCRRHLSCDNHVCNTNCCPPPGHFLAPSLSHVCMRQCGKMLSCGHVCLRSCHSSSDTGVNQGCGECGLGLQNMCCDCGDVVVSNSVVHSNPTSRKGKGPNKNINSTSNSNVNSTRVSCSGSTIAESNNKCSNVCVKGHSSSKLSAYISSFHSTYRNCQSYLSLEEKKQIHAVVYNTNRKPLHIPGEINDKDGDDLICITPHALSFHLLNIKHNRLPSTLTNSKYTSPLKNLHLLSSPSILFSSNALVNSLIRHYNSQPTLVSPVCLLGSNRRVGKQMKNKSLLASEDIGNFSKLHNNIFVGQLLVQVKLMYIHLLVVDIVDEIDGVGRGGVGKVNLLQHYKKVHDNHFNSDNCVGFSPNNSSATPQSSQNPTPSKTDKLTQSVCIPLHMFDKAWFPAGTAHLLFNIHFNHIQQIAYPQQTPSNSKTTSTTTPDTVTEKALSPNLSIHASSFTPSHHTNSSTSLNVGAPVFNPSPTTSSSSSLNISAPLFSPNSTSSTDSSDPLNIAPPTVYAYNINPPLHLAHISPVTTHSAHNTTARGTHSINHIALGYLYPNTVQIAPEHVYYYNSSSPTPSDKLSLPYLYSPSKHTVNATNALPNSSAQGSLQSSPPVIITLSKTSCTHSCKFKNHLSNCTICIQTTPKLCYCGKSFVNCRCNSSASCGGICGKLLRCRRHKCVRVCHVDDCDSVGGGECGTCNEELYTLFTTLSPHLISSLYTNNANYSSKATMENILSYAIHGLNTDTSKLTDRPSWMNLTVSTFTPLLKAAFKLFPPTINTTLQHLLQRRAHVTTITTTTTLFLNILPLHVYSIDTSELKSLLKYLYSPLTDSDSSEHMYYSRVFSLYYPAIMFIMRVYNNLYHQLLSKNPSIITTVKASFSHYLSSMDTKIEAVVRLNNLQLHNYNSSLSNLNADVSPSYLLPPLLPLPLLLAYLTRPLSLNACDNPCSRNNPNCSHTCRVGCHGGITWAGDVNNTTTFISKTYFDSIQQHVELTNSPFSPILLDSIQSITNMLDRVVETESDDVAATQSQLYLTALQHHYSPQSLDPHSPLVNDTDLSTNPPSLSVLDSCTDIQSYNTSKHNIHLTKSDSAVMFTPVYALSDSTPDLMRTIVDIVGECDCNDVTAGSGLKTIICDTSALSLPYICYKCYVRLCQALSVFVTTDTIRSSLSLTCMNRRVHDNEDATAKNEHSSQTHSPLVMVLSLRLLSVVLTSLSPETSQDNDLATPSNNLLYAPLTLTNSLTSLPYFSSSVYNTNTSSSFLSLYNLSPSSASLSVTAVSALMQYYDQLNIIHESCSSNNGNDTTSRFTLNLCGATPCVQSVSVSCYCNNKNGSISCMRSPYTYLTMLMVVMTHNIIMFTNSLSKLPLDHSQFALGETAIDVTLPPVMSLPYIVYSLTSNEPINAISPPLPPLPPLLTFSNPSNLAAITFFNSKVKSKSISLYPYDDYNQTKLINIMYPVSNSYSVSLSPLAPSPLFPCAHLNSLLPYLNCDAQCHKQVNANRTARALNINTTNANHMKVINQYAQHQQQIAAAKAKEERDREAFLNDPNSPNPTSHTNVSSMSAFMQEFSDFSFASHVQHHQMANNSLITSKGLVPYSGSFIEALLNYKTDAFLTHCYNICTSFLLHHDKLCRKSPVFGAYLLPVTSLNLSSFTNTIMPSNNTLYIHNFSSHQRLCMYTISRLFNVEAKSVLTHTLPDKYTINANMYPGSQQTAKTMILISNAGSSIPLYDCMYAMNMYKTLRQCVYVTIEPNGSYSDNRGELAEARQTLNEGSTQASNSHNPLSSPSTSSVKSPLTNPKNDSWEDNEVHGSPSEEELNTQKDVTDSTNSMDTPIGNTDTSTSHSNTDTTSDVLESWDV